jgi:hypothetical protein
MYKEAEAEPKEFVKGRIPTLGQSLAIREKNV